MSRALDVVSLSGDEYDELLSEHDKGFEAGVTSALNVIDAWSVSRLDSLEPGRNKGHRTYIETEHKMLIHLVKQLLTNR